MRGFLVLAVALAGCVPRAVTERIGALEARVAVLEAGGADRGPVQRGMNDPKVAAQFGVLDQHIASGDTEAAQQTLRAIMADNPDRQVLAAAQRTLAELQVVGTSAGVLAAGTESWLQGEADWSQGRHLVVFFETWCPHCRREIPQIDDRLAGRDASAVLLTRLSRDATVESVQEFLDTNDVTEPTAHVRQDVAERFGISGIPAAAIVKDGVIIWRGHPARLEGDLLERVLPAL